MTLTVLLCLTLTIPASAQETLVRDDAGLLSEWELESLEQRLQEISLTVDAQILVVTVDSVPGNDADAYIEQLYDSMGYGYGSTKSGVMLLLCMELRQYRILSNGLAGDRIGDGEIERIGDAIVSYLTDGDYAAAFHAFANKCETYLDTSGDSGTEDFPGFPGDFGTDDLPELPADMGKTLLISLGVGLVVGIIVMVILKGQLKSVRQQHQADAYIVAGSMRVTTARDIFLYRNVSKTRKQTNNSSGGSGGGSRHVGGGSF